jgi:hypothetical protein
MKFPKFSKNHNAPTLNCVPLSTYLESVNPLNPLSPITLFCFSWRYNPLWFYFHSPVAGFSLLVFEVSWSHTTMRHSREDSPGRVINPSQTPLPDSTQHSHNTHIHAPGGIRNHNLSRRVVEDLRFTPRGHWDQHHLLSTDFIIILISTLKTTPPILPTCLRSTHPTNSIFPSFIDLIVFGHNYKFRIVPVCVFVCLLHSSKHSVFSSTTNKLKPCTSLVWKII